MSAASDSLLLARGAADDDSSTRRSAMGLAFRNDLGNSAGLDKDGSLLELSYALGAGFTVVGTVLSEAHTGNVFSFLGGVWSGNAWTPLPLSGAALNSLGLPSKGVVPDFDRTPMSPTYTPMLPGCGPMGPRC